MVCFMFDCFLVLRLVIQSFIVYITSVDALFGECRYVEVAVSFRLIHDKEHFWINTVQQLVARYKNINGHIMDWYKPERQ